MKYLNLIADYCFCEAFTKNKLHINDFKEYKVKVDIRRCDLTNPKNHFVLSKYKKE